jgi:endonuclease YncB( thermonuclease family)
MTHLFILGRRILGYSLLATMIGLAGCDDPDKNTEPTSASTEVEKTVLQKTEVTQKKFELEPARKDLRIIGDGELPAPIVKDDKIERIEPLETAEEKNAAEKARIPKKPDIFSLPIAITSGILTSGETRITLKDIVAPEASADCNGQNGEWPCGNFAKSALQRLIRSRSITCNGEWKDTNEFQGACQVAGRDLAEWVIEQGWAKSSHPSFTDALNLAKSAKKGLWRD